MGYYRERLIREINSMIAEAKNRTWSGPQNLLQMCNGIDSWIVREDNSEGIEQLFSIYPSTSQDSITQAMTDIKAIIGSPNSKGYYCNFDMDKEQGILNILTPILTILSHQPLTTESVEVHTADTPCYFSKQRFRYKHMPDVLSSTEESSNRARENCSTMLMRIYRLFEDLDSIFCLDLASSEWSDVKLSLAAFYGIY